MTNEDRNREIEKWANDPRWSVVGHPHPEPDGPLDYVKLATAAVIMFALWPIVAAIFGREVWMARKIIERDGWIKWWLTLVVSGAGWTGLVWLLWRAL